MSGKRLNYVARVISNVTRHGRLLSKVGPCGHSLREPRANKEFWKNVFSCSAQFIHGRACDEMVNLPRAEKVVSRPSENCITFSNIRAKEHIGTSLNIYEDIISPKEEDSLLSEVLPILKRLRYEYDHWDDAIHGYRETERSLWKDTNLAVLQRIQQLVMPPNVPLLPVVHVLDIEQMGYIKPHVDSVRFCGSTVAGISLMSNAVMRFINKNDKKMSADALLPRRSLYVMRGTARYDYTHEVLEDKCSMFEGKHVPRGRRISIISRCEPVDHPDHVNPHEGDLKNPCGGDSHNESTYS